MEATLLLDSQHMDASYLKLILMNLSKTIQSELHFYTTIAYHSDPMPCHQLSELSKKLKYRMKIQLVIGLDQQIDCKQVELQDEKKQVLADEKEREISLLMQKGVNQGIKNRSPLF